MNFVPIESESKFPQFQHCAVVMSLDKYSMKSINGMIRSAVGVKVVFTKILKKFASINSHNASLAKTLSMNSKYL